MTEKEHQYYRRRALCDPDLIVCPACNGSGKVTRSSSEDDLLCWGAGVERAPVFRPEMNRTPPYTRNLNIL